VIRRKMPSFTFADVAQHSKDDDAWIVVNGKVYDISKWSMKHPGGQKLILFYKGQDATDAFNAFHPDKQTLQKYLPLFYLGDLLPEELNKIPQITKDFRQLREQIEKEGLLQSNKLFYFLHFSHIILMELMSIWLCYYYGTTRLGWWLTALLLGTSQIQAGWLQHDFGHLSVFEKRKMNESAHKLVIMALKGASMTWWKTRHNRHHAKTNVLQKDPDVEVAPIFLFSGMVKEYKGWKWIPYQQHYWWFIGPPLVTTFLFFYQNAMFVHGKKLKEESIWVILFFVRFVYVYISLLGFWSMFWLYWTMRFIESLWFTWVTSMNHLPMPIDHEENKDWVSQQIITTQNVDQSFFNDWFTGHLNFQCEHHLFPTMPRHNFHKVHKRVVQLCKENGLNVRVRPLFGAFKDILDALAITAAQWSAIRKKNFKN